MSVAISSFRLPDDTERLGVPIDLNAPVVIVQQAEQNVRMARWVCTASCWLTNEQRGATILANSTSKSP
jgi:hypothetical protein